MGVLSLYKVFRNNTEQKKKEKGKEGKAGRKRKEEKEEGKKERKEKRRRKERRKDIYWIKRMQEKTDKGSEGLFLQ